MKLTEEQQARLREKKAQVMNETDSQQEFQQASSNTNRAKETSEQAKTLAVEGIALISQRGSETLQNLGHHLTRIQEQREMTVEQASDMLAYLHDPRTLEADITRRTLEKLGINPNKAAEPQQISVLSDPYEGFTVNYPVLPTSIAGCLPVS